MKTILFIGLIGLPQIVFVSLIILLIVLAYAQHRKTIREQEEAEREAEREAEKLKKYRAEIKIGVGVLIPSDSYDKIGKVSEITENDVVVELGDKETIVVNISSIEYDEERKRYFIAKKETAIAGSEKKSEFGCLMAFLCTAIPIIGLVMCAVYASKGENNNAGKAIGCFFLGLVLFGIIIAIASA